MGFAVSPCPLSPSFIEAQETYISRSFTSGSTGLITLIAVEEGRVIAWQDFDLPGFQGWVTHYSRRCEGSNLEFSDREEVFFRYRWTGQEFVQEPLED